MQGTGQFGHVVGVRGRTGNVQVSRFVADVLASNLMRGLQIELGCFNGVVHGVLRLQFDACAGQTCTV